MVITIIDTKPRKVLLTVDEMQIIKDSLEYQSHNLFRFLNCGKIINKLNKAMKND